MPPVEALVERAESSRGELLALRKEIEAAPVAGRAADRRWIPEPEIVAGTKSSSAGGGDVGSVFACKPRFRCSTVASPSGRWRRRGPSGRGADRGVSRCCARRSPAGAPPSIERRDAAERYRAAAVDSADQIERIAQVSYDAGERGILELLDAYRTRSRRACGRPRSTRRCGKAEIELEFVSGWEIP